MLIVLVHPQIPQNAGNVVRTCAVTGNQLALVEPLGFETSSKMLRRAGLDYWEGVDVTIYKSFDELLDREGHRPLYFFSSHSTKLYTEATFEEDALLIFGSETAGLPSTLQEKFPESFYTLPMVEGKRCLNLSNAVAIVTYEAWRQRGFVSQV